MADDDTTTAGDTAVPPDAGSGAPEGRRRRRWWPAPLVVLVVLVLVWWALGFWSVNYYAITPGQAQPVAPLITVPAHLDHPLTGTILLTDVYVTQLTARTYLQERYLSSDNQILPTSELLGPATPPDQFVAQGYLQMNQAQSFATAAALTKLGYTVTDRPAGALVYGIVPGSPAASTLKVAQVITALNGKTTPTSCALVASLQGLKPGTTATLSVDKATISNSGVVKSGPTVPTKVTLGKPPAGVRDTGCGATTTPTAYLGIETQDQVAWTFPVKVSINTADIGGPSAGLSMTLGIIDKLSGGHLTGKRVVAATGTMDPQGDVGDVGGVAEKTIAVERAGATVFFVPPQELAAARSTDTPQLHVYAVSSLDQALRILQRLGGTLPTSHVSAEAAP